MHRDLYQSRIGAPLVALCLFASLCAATVPRGGDEPLAVPIEAKVSAPLASTPTNWAEIQEHASALLGRRVRFVVQFKQAVPSWRAYQSRFGPRTHAAFQGWADEQFLWQREQYESPLVRVFVRRGSAVEARLAAAPTYSRFELVGTVRELFLSVPWIEIDEARALPERVGEGAVIHAARAIELARAESWTLAESELQQALQGTLPTQARRELERLRAGCQAAAQGGTPDSPAPARPWLGGSPPVRIERRHDDG